MDAALRAYAQRLLDGTGIAVDDIPLLETEASSSAIEAALRAGWRCAADPIPPLPTPKEETEEPESELP